MSLTTAPHLSDSPLTTSRRGHFWIPGERVDTGSGTVQRAPMYVAWEAPETITQPHPLVLIHGGGGQGTDWMGTVDGRPGWARRFVDAGFAVYIVDRPGHGRSPYHPDVVGPMGGAFPYEAAVGLFAPAEAAASQTQWGYDREIGSYDLDQLVSSMGPLPAALDDSQAMDADRLARLLDRIGPAVIVSHSAGAPAGWLAADRRPELVMGIAAVEPIGPAFVEFPGMGTLSWGLTAAPVTFDPPVEDSQSAKAADPQSLRIPGLAGKPIAVFTGSASGFAGFAPDVVSFLNSAGAEAEWVRLSDHGLEGNGHGLIFESNSDETVKPIISWITAHWPSN
jgi:pimeloyl-ACP methyl ester carboxylesterase